MKLMHISFGEANDTPMTIIRRHLEIDDIENQIKQMKAQEQNA